MGINYLQDFAGLSLETKGLDCIDQFLGRDAAALIIVEYIKALFELDYIIHRQVFSRIQCRVEG